MTVEEDEAASQALIHAILMQEQQEEGYMEDWDASMSHYHESAIQGHDVTDALDESADDDDDWRRNGSYVKKNKRKAMAAAAERKRQAAAEKLALKQEKKRRSELAKEAAKSGKSSTVEVDADGNVIKKDKMKPVLPEGINSGPFTDEEERLFVEGLELFGRDWARIERHIQTRTQPSIRSHAQKHFIKLFRDNKPLPPKVLESGSGYTLSGKELDVHSASARGYLNASKRKSGACESLFEQNNISMALNNAAIKSTPRASSYTSPPPTEPIEGHVEKNVESLVQQGKIISVDALCHPTELNVSDFNSTQTSSPSLLDPSLSASKNTTSKIEPRIKRPRKSAVDDIIPPERLHRPKRAVAVKNVYGDKDPHSLHPLSQYSTDPLNAKQVQPFKIRVDPTALALIDFHAHLMQTEVIGFVAGEWNEELKELTISSAYPCRGLDEPYQDEAILTRHTNVEMDPTSEVEVRAKIKEAGKKVVGWYHSHPTFEPIPSLIDLENQRNYQMLFRASDEACDVKDGCPESIKLKSCLEGEEPFVGIIAAPYDPNLPTSLSAINWFYVGNSQNTGSSYADSIHNATRRYDARQLSFSFMNDELVKNEGIFEADFKEMVDLIHSNACNSDKTVFSSTWHPTLPETRMEKMVKCLKYRLMDEGRIRRMKMSETELYGSTSALCDSKPRVSVVKVLETLEREIKSCFK